MNQFCTIETAKGPMAISWNQTFEIAAVALPFSSSRNLKVWLAENWSDKADSDALPKPLKKLGLRIQSYFAGKADDFKDVAVDQSAFSEFQTKVYKELRRVRTSSTITYGELGDRVGRQGAVRAVGTCMAKNPCPLIIPCHRVLAANGKVGSFSAEGGASMKSWMLKMEGAEVRG